LETPAAPEKTAERCSRLDKRTNEILRALQGDQALRQRNMNLPPSISDSGRRHRRLAADVNGRGPRRRRWISTRGAQDFETTLNQLRQLIEGDLARLEKQMEAAGAPWTPGRIPEWKDQ